MVPFYVNVLVGGADHNGDLDPYSCVVYKFNNWEEASSLIKLSLDNNLICEVRLPVDAEEQAV